MREGGRRACWVAGLIVLIAAAVTVTAVLRSRPAEGDIPTVCTLVGCASRVRIEIYDHLNVPDPWPADVGSVRVCIDTRCSVLRHRDGQPNRNALDVEDFSVHPRARQRRAGAQVPAGIQVRDRAGAVTAARSTAIRVDETFPNGRRCGPRCFGGGVRFVLRSLEFQRLVAASAESRRLLRVARTYSHRRYGRPNRRFTDDDRCDTWQSPTTRQYECVVGLPGLDGYLLEVFARDSTGLRLANAAKDFDPDIPLRCAAARLPADIACGPPPGED